tara:strand:+ start:156 stop:449 length:294 start_codon:yes stop_codon:yes gene_type:complete
MAMPSSADSPFRAAYDPQHPRFRRALCRHWQRWGSCERGDLCNFAHGEEQLARSLVRGTQLPTARLQQQGSAIVEKYESLADEYVMVAPASGDAEGE